MECTKQIASRDWDPDSFGRAVLEELDEDNNGKVFIFNVFP